MPNAGVQTVFDRVGGPEVRRGTRADQLTVEPRTLVPGAGAGVFACPEFEGGCARTARQRRPQRTLAPKARLSQ